ncbi:ADP-ribosyltransferase domain-containing protein [Nocardia sp. NPDC051463]|uniref:ADP-ribosyltransferase domain-containing protein n=1 Tax=Nocardia sp. NPDC051463 TaxID=3154845 RepID=UPI00344E2D4B
MSQLPARSEPLWRGVSLDLRAQYPLGRTVTWWGVSSCTSQPSVARGFLGSRGKRTLFEVLPARAVSIRNFSAFTDEEEFVLLPGTQLEVTRVKAARGGLCTVTLTDSDERPSCPERRTAPGPTNHIHGFPTGHAGYLSLVPLLRIRACRSGRASPLVVTAVVPLYEGEARRQS